MLKIDYLTDNLIVNRDDFDDLVNAIEMYASHYGSDDQDYERILIAAERLTKTAIPNRPSIN